MTLSPSLRKLALTTHVTSTLGWVGAAGAFFALAVTGLNSADGQLVRGSYIAMDVIARYAILPLALASVASGIVQGLGTPWGLFSHYWVVIKLVITVIAALVLLSELGPIRDMADAASSGTLSSTDLRTERFSLIVHSGVGVLVLLIPTALSIYKPKGLTRRGRRRAAASSR